jgi:hypothetical protein
MNSLRGGISLFLFLGIGGCREEGKPPVPRRPRPVAQAPAAEPSPPPAPAAEPSPPPAPAAEKANDDPSWLAGTWQRGGEPRWLLFNVPAEVAELAGKPARVVRRGKLVIHGRFISAIFQDGELQLEGTRDRAELLASGGGVYRRGSPP